jgi:hypothetical protein
MKRITTGSKRYTDSSSNDFALPFRRQSARELPLQFAGPYGWKMKAEIFDPERSWLLRFSSTDHLIGFAQIWL